MNYELRTSMRISARKNAVWQVLKGVSSKYVYGRMKSIKGSQLDGCSAWHHNDDTLQLTIESISDNRHGNGVECSRRSRSSNSSRRRRSRSSRRIGSSYQKRRQTIAQ
ncbi:PREDICTED: uncharacterized protein LOC108617008 [Drosophila arizonae]|uniref:Uncharacterized protein LOC108617008 n=1 Tax=Drosophila arizonae TaxID=7263 RepID=A0ABM1PLL9_DROAR|nr:PREDICTED: uncharacterized protein LOC108617008 [Drosophila arizonae]